MALPEEFRQTLFRLEDAPDELPEEFAIITAWNPMGRVAPLSENLAADASLHEELRRSTRTLFRATGGSPDFSHSEPGWAAGIPLEVAVRLGRRFSQLAVWWIVRDTLHLVDCATGACESIGPFRPRLR